MSRTLRPLAALAMLAVIVAGGSNAPAGTGSSGGNSIAATHEKAVKFAECMRDNGVSAFPDPDASGELTIDGIANGSSLDPSTAAFEAWSGGIASAILIGAFAGLMPALPWVGSRPSWCRS
jgi:hypothetical protein